MMFELTIIQKKGYKEEIVLYFEQNQIEEMFILINSIVKAAKIETEYAIRVIEEGQIEDED